jgi:hypothetical protein
VSGLGLNGAEFHDLARQILGSGNQLRFQARGQSMHPSIQDGDVLVVAPLAGKRIRCADVLLVDTGRSRLLAHRVIKIDRTNRPTRFLLKMDTGSVPDGWFTEEGILGRVEALERGAIKIRLTSGLLFWKARIWLAMAPWASKFIWLPERFRQRLRHWLLVVASKSPEK